MIDFEQMKRDIQTLNLNLYDFALYTDQGLKQHKFQKCNTCNNSYSIGKAFVMTAIGLLCDDGLVHVEDRLSVVMNDLFPPVTDDGWKIATVEQALTHHLGFASDFLDIDVDDVTSYPTDDYLSLVLSHPLEYLPGTHYAYSDAAFYLLARLVEHVSGKTLDAFLYERLLSPMHFHEIAWSRCPHGHPIGATGMYASAADIVKLGWLYLNGGVFEGRHLLSAKWVKRVLTREYELHMMTPNGLIGKGGMYGQGLVLSKEGRFAVSWHGYEGGAGIERLIDYLDSLHR